MVQQGAVSLEGLEKPCASCDGQGVVYNPVWEEYFRRREIGPQPQPKEPEEIACVECEGWGEVLTLEGAKLMLFLRKWLER